jgi:hypothetical protein
MYFSNCQYRGLLRVYDYMFRRIASSSGRPQNSEDEALLLIFYKSAGTYAPLWTFRTTCIEVSHKNNIATVFLQHIGLFISIFSHVYIILNVYVTVRYYIYRTGVLRACLLRIKTILINKIKY